MLRKRLITVLTFVDGVLFRTKKFVPDYRYTLNFVDAWSVDEIIVLDVTRDPNNDHSAFKGVVNNLAKNCFVPMCAGGGIRTLDDAKAYLDIGADKVVINSGIFEQPNLVSTIAKAYGSQCAVAAVDVRKSEKGYEVFSHFGKKPTGKSPVEWVQELENMGVGEIMVTSIDRDGSLSGYDLDLCQQVTEKVSVPVLICGGAGNWKHFSQGFLQGGADAVCTANIYHFTETSIHSAKSYLDKAGILVRR